MRQQGRLRNISRKIGVGFAVMAFSVVVTGLIGEFIVRAFFPQPMLPRYVIDTPYGIRRNMSNLNIWHTSPDYHINVRTNSHGVRADREIPYEKPRGVYRIIGLGDSFTLGYEVDVENTFLSQLEEKLHERGYTNVEVVNLAVSGFGTAEELLTLENEGLKYSPDMVILGYFVNDIENNATSNLYQLKGDRVQRAAKEYLPAMGMRKTLFAIPGYNYLEEHSQLLNIFRNILSYYIYQGMVKKHSEQEATQLGYDRSEPSAEVDSSVSIYQSTLTARLLDEIYKVCHVHGIPFLLLNIPNVTTKTATVENNIPLQYMHYGDRIIYIDATTILAPYIGKVEIQWEKWHGHWKPWVHQLVSRVLADTVEHYLPPRENQFGRASAIGVSRQNNDRDLARSTASARPLDDKMIRDRVADPPRTKAQQDISIHEHRPPDLH